MFEEADDTADFLLAQELQQKFDAEANDPDLAMARLLQEEYDEEVAFQLSLNDLPKEVPSEKAQSSSKLRSTKDVRIVDQFWELNDPNPDIHALFMEFNKAYFWKKLDGVEVRWSPRMTLCAGLCCYEGRGGLCSIRLSQPLLKLRPRRDLVQTLLHEMIHAYLFVTQNNRDHDAHGPEFHKHMYRINKETGANITVYHNFHDEVNSYRVHWWRCNGPCKSRHPFYGYVKRAMNRAPSVNDLWWDDHQRTCGGMFIKIKEPEPKNGKRKPEDSPSQSSKKKKIMTNDIARFFQKQSNASLKSISQGLSSNNSKHSIPPMVSPLRAVTAVSKKGNISPRMPSVSGPVATLPGEAPLKKPNTVTLQDLKSPKAKGLEKIFTPFSGKGKMLGGQNSLEKNMTVQSGLINASVGRKTNISKVTSDYFESSSRPVKREHTNPFASLSKKIKESRGSLEGLVNNKLELLKTKKEKDDKKTEPKFHFDSLLESARCGSELSKAKPKVNETNDTLLYSNSKSAKDSSTGEDSSTTKSHLKFQAADPIATTSKSNSAKDSLPELDHLSASTFQATTLKSTKDGDDIIVISSDEEDDNAKQFPRNLAIAEDFMYMVATSKRPKNKSLSEFPRKDSGLPLGPTVSVRGVWDSNTGMHKTLENQPNMQPLLKPNGLVSSDLSSAQNCSAILPKSNSTIASMQEIFASALNRLAQPRNQQSLLKSLLPQPILASLPSTSTVPAVKRTTALKLLKHTFTENPMVTKLNRRSVSSPVNKLMKIFNSEKESGDKLINAATNKSDFNILEKLKSMASSSTKPGTKTDSMPEIVKQNDEESIQRFPCPVCSKKFPEAEINAHLDLCLE